MCVTVCLPWFIFFQICALHDIPSKHSISVKTLRKKKKKKGILVYFDATGFLFSILVLEMHCCVFPEHALLFYIFFTCIILKLLFFSPICNSYPDNYFLAQYMGWE